MNKVIQHIRGSAVAYVALFIALGGTSYALSLPAGSVGTRQLRNGSVTSKKLANGSITPVKLDPSTIGGSVRHWALSARTAALSAAATELMRLRRRSPGSHMTVGWRDQFSHSCAVLANSPGTDGNGPIADRIGIHVNEPGTRHGATVVWVWPSSDGSFVNARFYIAVVC